MIDKSIDGKRDAPTFPSSCPSENYRPCRTAVFLLIGIILLCDVSGGFLNFRLIIFI